MKRSTLRKRKASEFESRPKIFGHVTWRCGWKSSDVDSRTVSTTRSHDSDGLVKISTNRQDSGLNYSITSFPCNAITKTLLEHRLTPLPHA